MLANFANMSVFWLGREFQTLGPATEKVYFKILNMNLSNNNFTSDKELIMKCPIWKKIRNKEEFENSRKQRQMYWQYWVCEFIMVIRSRIAETLLIHNTNTEADF